MTIVEKYNTLVGLVKALRAYSWTPATTPDEGRDHPLYPSNNRHNRFPLWQAINELLVEEKEAPERIAELEAAIESMRTAGGSAEFQAAFDRAKALIA